MYLITIRQYMIYDKRINIQVLGGENYDTQICIEWYGFPLSIIMEGINNGIGYKNVSWMKCMPEDQFIHLKTTNTRVAVLERLLVYIKEKSEKCCFYMEIYKEMKKNEILS